MGAKAVCQFEFEELLARLIQIRRGQTAELTSHVVDQIETAVWAVVVAKSDVGTDRLVVCPLSWTSGGANWLSS